MSVEAAPATRPPGPRRAPPRSTGGAAAASWLTFGLRLHVAVDGVAVRVRMEGEVDLATIGVLEGTLDGLHRAGVRQFTFDLSELTFIDTTGASAVWRLLAGDPGASVVFVGCSATVEQLLRLTGLGDHVRWADR